MAFLTATNTPRQVVVTCPAASSVASTTALRSLDSTTQARKRNGPSVGVGFFNLTWNSAVTVLGGM